MREIKNVLICGLGAVGTVYANIIEQYSNLKILVDESRIEKYKNNPIVFNGKKLSLDYVLPNEKDFKSDLIIISTKYNGLFEVIKNIKNFVAEDTIILSLLNGVTSEKLIAEKYGAKRVLYSYFIGHSAVRVGRNVTQDGVNKIVFGYPTKNENIQTVKKYFDEVGINYEIPEDIIYSMWLKYMLNVSTNQISAVLNYTFGEMLNNQKCMELVVNVMKEVQLIAKVQGVNNYENMINDALFALNTMSPEGKTSMLQDVLAKRKTEVDMFAGEIINFGKKHNIQTPYNNILRDLIKTIEFGF